MACGKYSQNVRKVRESFLFLGSNQGIDYERIKNSMERGKEKKRKEKKKERRKRKEMRKRKERRRKERKERKTKEMRKNPCVEEKGLRFPCSNSRKSLVRELKLVYSMRATSRCQKQKR